MMSNIEVTSLSVFGDNYIHIIQYDSNIIVVDPTLSSRVSDFLKNKNLSLSTILITHHHYDHIGGNEHLKTATNCTIIGPDDDRIPCLDRRVYDGENITIGPLSFTVFSVPGHTASHIIYFMPEQKILFSGDFLFSGGCGRVFEGTYEQMFSSLQILATLPKDTAVYFGHDYASKNMQFAEKIDPNNAMIKKRKITMPSTLALEYEINPFLRLQDPAIRKNLNLENATDLEVFEKLRRMRNEF